jgi:hypothetical protein
LAEGRALEHRQRFCDWDNWSKYAMLEQVFFFVTGTNGPNMPCSSRLFFFSFCDWDKWSKYAMLERAVCLFLIFVNGTNCPNMPICLHEQAICFVLFFFCFLFVTGTNGPSKYAMLEQALLARSSEERVLTPFQVRVVF